MKIGIYGGTFNPIHKGHVNIIKGFKEKLNLDNIIVIPTAEPPHKHSHCLASSEDRLNMCKIALNDLGYCIISDIEIKRKGKSYTIDTLKELKKCYPTDEIYLLMGEDMFMIIDEWRSFEEIFSIATICATSRSIDGIKNLINFAEDLRIKYKNFKCEIVDIKYFKASSTDIRNGEKNLIIDEVCDYIKKNKLYS